MKIFNLFLAVLFFLFAAVQLNDTPGDILFWFMIYALIAFISAFAAFNKYNMWAILLGLAVVVFELFRKFPTFATWIGEGMPSIIAEMKATTPYVELAREYLGLVICLAVLIFHYVRFSRIRRQEEPFVE
ncbi:MAG: transmembrane 220 family protein [Saprospiraceae bacterium]|nr:transmembrane 220 family protein [Candidatus Opimibacter iunctus]